jgi:hypothetical protein
MDGYIDIPPSVICDRNLSARDRKTLGAYVHVFFAPGTKWNLVLPNGVEHMTQSVTKD